MYNVSEPCYFPMIGLISLACFIFFLLTQNESESINRFCLCHMYWEYYFCLQLTFLLGLMFYYKGN